MNICPASAGDTAVRTRARVQRTAALPRVSGVKVLKFGGSSLATPERIVGVGRIVLGSVNGSPAVVVVSAFQGVTNQLIDCARLAETRHPDQESTFDRIAARHREAIATLLDGDHADKARVLVDEQLDELRGALADISRLGHCSPAALDTAASFGERMSALIVSAYLNRFRRTPFVDARRFITTDDRFTCATVNVAKTNSDAQQYFSSLWRKSRGAIPVVTGFIGRTEDGRTTTVGRNGSDYTATVIGGALDASVIEIWTDVDGVLSADPKHVGSAFVLPQMTYEEAMEMSYFGAKVLHAPSIGPAVAKAIPILVKNTFNPSAAGTRISKIPAVGCRPAKGISSVDDVTLLTLRGPGAAGILGTAERLCRALDAQRINVVLLCQASSERTISLAVRTSEAAAASDAIAREFRLELDAGLAALTSKPDQAVIAVVGDGVQGRSDVAGQVFGALGRHNIAVGAIAHGAIDRSLSFVVPTSQLARAVNVVHRRCFEARRSLALAIVGVGNIGGTLLRQLHERQAHLAAQGFDISVVALANSKRFVVSAEGLDLARWAETLYASSQPMDPCALARELARLELAHVALVDCTAAQAVVDAYPEFIRADLHIVTPNKRANVLPWERYTELRDLLAAQQRHFLYETNVGAGLPIMSTLRNLMVSGDVVTRIEGIFSGTLSYLFNTFDGTVPFSALVRDAHARGFTEPDPREDLAGQDVARKLLILARHTGLRMELDDVRVDSLVPRCLSDLPFSERFFAQYAALDADMRRRLESAKARGTVLRYVGTLEDGRASAGIREFPRDHAFATTKGSDNVIAFTGTRSGPTPLIVQGPGAGAEVTATGVFADILELLRCLPH